MIINTYGDTLNLCSNKLLNQIILYNVTHWSMQM